MASYTPKLNLKKPAGGEYVDVNDLNGNMDILDNVLPLSGGRLTGNLSIETPSPNITLNNNQINAITSVETLATGAGQMVVTDVENTTGIRLNNPKSFSAEDRAMLFSEGKEYRLLGQHNFLIQLAASGEEVELDNFFRSGAHVKLLRTNPNTNGTPYKQGITSGYGYSLVLSYTINFTHGIQVAFVAGKNLVFVRSMVNGNITEWVPFNN